MKKYLFNEEVYSLGQLQKANVNKEDTIELEVVIPAYNKSKQRLTTKTAIIDTVAKTYTFGIENIVHYAIFDKNNNFIESIEQNPSDRHEDATVIVMENLELLSLFEKHNCYLRDGDIVYKPSFVNAYKKHKKTIIKKAKKVYQNRSVPVPRGDEVYNFFGGKENGEKYEDAMNTALRLGMTEGSVKVEEGMISVTKEYMDTALGLIGLQGYRGWAKENHYSAAIDACNTVEELEAIVWEDVYTGNA